MKPRTESTRPLFRVINNVVAFLGGEFVYRLVNFVSGVLVARSLGGARYGEFSFIYVYLSFFEIFVQFGMNSILTRRVAQNREGADRILGNALLLRLILITAAIPAAFFLIRGLGYPLSVRQGVGLASLQLFLGIRTIFETIFRVNLLMIYPALWNGIRSVVNLILVFAVVSFYPSVKLFILAYLVSGFVGLGGLTLFSARFITPRFSIDGRLMKELLQESFPLILSGYLTLLYYRVDVFMLSRMKGFLDVGYYSVATRLTESLDVIASSLTLSLFPLLSRSFKEDRSQFQVLTGKAFYSLLLLGLPLAIGGSLAARDLIRLFFGVEYLPSGTTLGILFWYTFFGFFSTLLVNLLIVCGRQIVDTWVSLFLVIANVAMNLILIPRFSYNGAAAATVMVEIFGAGTLLAYLARHPSIRLRLPVAEWNPLFQANLLFFVFMMASKFLLRLPVLAFVAFGVLVYAALVFAMKLVSTSNLKNYFTQGVRAFAGSGE